MVLGDTSGSRDQLLAAGSLVVDPTISKARITPQVSRQQIFRVAVGVTGHPVDSGWNAVNQRYQWFGKAPKQVTSGAHLFVLAVDRWTARSSDSTKPVSPGAVKLPGSPDANHWPFALGVRPLAAVLPPEAVQVKGQRGPQSRLPEHIYDADAHRRLYAAVAGSPPPRGPRTVEQRVQELEPIDVEPDVLEAVGELARAARRPAVIVRAVELGAWSHEELSARAWYTGIGPDSHIENITVRACSSPRGSGSRPSRARASSGKSMGSTPWSTPNPGALEERGGGR